MENHNEDLLNSSADEANNFDVYKQYRHKYGRLGGWLLFIVISNIISVANSLINTCSLYSQYNSAVQYGLPQQDANFLSTVMLLSTLVIILGSAASIIYVALIIKKSPYFLIFFELNTIISLVISLALIIFINSGGTQADYSSSIFSFIISIVGFFIWLSYYRNSLRVRVYMGSDAYLRKSIFSKNAKEPMPPYEEIENAKQRQKAEQFAQKPREIKTKNCPFCTKAINKDAVFCEFCGGDVQKQEEEEKEIKQQELEEKGIRALFDDEDFMKQANELRRIYGKSTYISYLNNKLKELGSSDTLNEDDVE